MSMFFGLIGFFGMLIFGIMSIIGLFQKNGKAKKRVMLTGISFVLFILGLSIPSPESNAIDESAKIEEKEEKKLTPEELAAKKAEEEKKAVEEAKRKAEEEVLAKKVAEEKAAAEKAAQELAEKQKAEKKANAQPIPFPQLEKNPERYKDQYVKYTGQIIQIMEGDNLTNIRLSVTKESYGYSVNDIIFVEYAGLTDFVEDDIVTIYGTIYGTYSYESQAGYNISLPGLIAEEITQ